MRIGINATVLGDRDTGVEVWTRGLIRTLSRINGGNEYVVFAREGVGLFGETGPPECMRVHRVRGVGNSRTARILWEETRLPALSSGFGLDLLHCPAYVAPARMPVPTVVTLHDLFVYTHPACCRLRNRIHFRLRLPGSIRRAARIHCTSHWTRDCLRDQFPSVQSRACVVHPAVDDIFRPLAERVYDEYREEHRLPEKPFLFVGNPEPKKNLSCVLRAFSRLQTQGEGGEHLILVGGKGWVTTRVDRMIREFGLEGAVTRTGYVTRKNLPFLYGMSRALVFPSVAEGFGLPPLESMACGTPVISTRAGGLAESVGDAGLIVDPSGVKQLADAMKHLSESSGRRAELSRAGLHRAQKFRWDRLIDDILRMYAEAAGAQRG